MWFVTLTYAEAWPADWRVWNSHVAAMRKRLLRRWPECSGLWRLEFQQRGAPHFHIVLRCRESGQRRLYTYLAAAWSYIRAGSAAPVVPDRAAVDVSRLDAGPETAGSLGTYLTAKKTGHTGGPNCGKTWDTFGGKLP